MITVFTSSQTDCLQFFCGTNRGHVMRCATNDGIVGSESLPKVYIKSQLLDESFSRVNAIRLNANHLIVGYSDGIICYYDITNQKAKLIIDTNNSPVIDIQWLTNRSATFVVLKGNNEFFIWDLIRDDIRHVHQYRHDSNKYTLNCCHYSYNTFNSQFLQSYIDWIIECDSLIFSE